MLILSTVVILAALGETRIDVFVSLFSVEYFATSALYQPRKRYADIIGVILFIVFLYSSIVVPEGAEGLKWLGEYRRANPIFKYGPRVLALVFWSISYALHRKYHKAMVVMGRWPGRQRE